MDTQARLAQIKAHAEAAGVSALEIGRRSGLERLTSHVLNGKFEATEATVEKIAAAIHGSVTFTAEARLETGETFQVKITAPADVIRRALADGQMVIG